MTTVALTASPATIDPGTAYEMRVVNSGSSVVHVQIGGGSVYDQRLNPGQSVVVHPNGQAVTGFARSGSGQVDTTLATNPEPPVSTGTSTPLSAAKAGGHGIVGKGYKIPAGSLDVWRAARDASAATRCEVVGFGDSLMFGQGPAGGFYSFMQRLRERAVADGFTDGGRGINTAGIQTPVDNYTGESAPVSAISGFAAAAPAAIVLIPGGAISTTSGDSITYKVNGNRARLWFSRYSAAGRFSYSVNGAAAVTVNAAYNELPPLPAAAGRSSSLDSLLLTSADGLVSGDNTITVVNLGGAPISPPVPIGSGAFSTGGTIPAGTYYYFITTGPTAGGEGLPGAAIGPITVASGQKAYLQYNAQGLGFTNRFYRGTTTNPAAAGLIGSQASSNTALEFDDTGGTAPGVAPPTVAGGLDGVNKAVAVNVEALKAAGIVWQNNGVQATTSYTLFDPIDADNNGVALALLGLQWGTGTNGIGVGTASELLPTAAQSAVDTPIARTRARVPALAVLAFGTNDIQQADGGAVTLGAPTAVTAGAGVGSGLAAGTYYYKLQQISASPFGGGLLSPASAGVTVTAGQQVAVTTPTIGSGNYVRGAAFNVFRATSAGGTYGLVGQIVGGGGESMIDTIATPGAAPIQTTLYSPTVDTSRTENSLALALRLIRNAGADALVVLPSIESLNNSRSLGGVFKAAIARVADAFGVAWVDFDVALGPVPLRSGLGYGGGGNNPHLLKPAYQKQGDFIWDNVLKV